MAPNQPTQGQLNKAKTAASEAKAEAKQARIDATKA